MKAAYYPDVGLEQLVPDQFWIEEECKYDIAAMYGISHWWFQRQRFYIDRFLSEGDRRAVRTHIRILSVVRIEVFSMYGYNNMKKIVLRRVDLKEYVIAERDFKYMYPSDFEDLNLVIRQRMEDFHLGIKSYQTQLNLTKPRWEATGFEFKHDYTYRSPKARSTFQRQIRGSDDHELCGWKDPLKALRLLREKLRYEGYCSHDPPEPDGIPHGYKPLVSVDVLRCDYKKEYEIRLKMNLPDHRSILTDQEDQAKMEMETPHSSRVNSPPNAHS
ncbi:hypothetical protein Tco_1254204 [Tanacetum coccineum]